MLLPLLNSEPLPFLLGRIDLSLPVILTSLPRRSALRPSAARSPPCRSSARALLRPRAPPLPRTAPFPLPLLCPRASPSSRCSSSAALHPPPAPLLCHHAGLSSAPVQRPSPAMSGRVLPSPSTLGWRGLLRRGLDSAAFSSQASVARILLRQGATEELRRALGRDGLGVEEKKTVDSQIHECTSKHELIFAGCIVSIYQIHPNNSFGIMTHYQYLSDFVLKSIQYQAFQYLHPNKA